MGRPAKLPSARRSEGVRVRLTPAELEQVRARAASLGLPVAEYMRRTALSRALPTPIPAVNSELVKEFAHIGRNLNQLTRHLNAVAGLMGANELARTKELLDRFWAKLGELGQQLQVSPSDHERLE